jgi:DNA-binding protein H-NS
MNLELIRKKISELKKQEEKLLKGRNEYIERVLKQLSSKGVGAKELSTYLKNKSDKLGRKRKATKSILGSTDSDGRSKVQVKYRDPLGNTWSGRGKPPKWMVEFERSGGKREELLVSMN